MIAFILFGYTTWISIISFIALLFMPGIHLFIEAQDVTTANMSTIQEAIPSNHSVTPLNTISYTVTPINVSGYNSGIAEVGIPFVSSSPSFTVTNLTITVFQDTLVGITNNDVAKSITTSSQKVLLGSVENEVANPTISIIPRNLTILTPLG